MLMMLSVNQCAWFAVLWQLEPVHLPKKEVADLSPLLQLDPSSSRAGLFKSGHPDQSFV